MNQVNVQSKLMMNDLYYQSLNNIKFILRCLSVILILQVLKKADMIRKNAVESILAERNILISVRNPFVVSWFNNLFPSKEALYVNVNFSFL